MGVPKSREARCACRQESRTGCARRSTPSSLAKLEEKNLKPNPPADKVTLIRRATFDLTGLAADAGRVQAFVADSSPDAFEKVSTACSPRRTTASAGAGTGSTWPATPTAKASRADETRPNIWRYRDYVIESFNEDKPYDRFIEEQIAGDEFYPERSGRARSPPASTAIGPTRATLATSMQRRQEILNDITDTVRRVFLGLTFGCARCHDHKFDPILHKDYYRLQAFFANTAQRRPDPACSAADERREYQQQLAAWEAKTKDIRAEMHEAGRADRRSMYDGRLRQVPARRFRRLSLTPAGQRTPMQWQMYYKAKPQLELA